MTLLLNSAGVERAGWRGRVGSDDMHVRVSVCVWGGEGTITQINCRPLLTPLRKEM